MISITFIIVLGAQEGMAQGPLGVHVTISPTPMAGIAMIDALGIDCCQLFTHNPRGWAFKPLDERQTGEFRAAIVKRKIVPVISHCNYLINLAAPTFFDESVHCLAEELRYAKAFGCTYFVLHVGKSKDTGTEAGIASVIKGIASVRDELLSSGVMLLLETVAGQGSEVGAKFEDLNRIIEGLPLDLRSHVGVCLDTCHVWSAGYDLSTKEGIETTVNAIKRTFGLEKLKAIHLNDAKGVLGAHLDRHEHIGLGTIGKGFGHFLNHPAIAPIPKILETPDDEQGGFAEDLVRVKEFLH